MNTKTLTLRTNAQRAIFVHELVGQFSDGMWENSGPRDHWMQWSQAEVVVGDKVGRNFWAAKDNYAITSKSLLDVVGERMITYVKLATVFTDKQVEVVEGYLVHRGEVRMSEHGNSTYVIKQIARAFGEDFDFEVIKATAKAVLSDTSYGMPQLLADLREIKAAMKTVK